MGSTGLEPYLLRPYVLTTLWWLCLVNFCIVQQAPYYKENHRRYEQNQLYTGMTCQVNSTFWTFLAQGRARFLKARSAWSEDHRKKTKIDFRVSLGFHAKPEGCGENSAALNQAKEFSKKVFEKVFISIYQKTIT